VAVVWDVEQAMATRLKQGEDLATQHLFMMRKEHYHYKTSRIEHLRMSSLHAKTAALFPRFSAKTVLLVGEMPQKPTRIVYTKDAVNSVRARLAKVSRLYRRTRRHTDSSS
jgi:hypothetical protein